jgi:hypothetical protein
VWPVLGEVSNPPASPDRIIVEEEIPAGFVDTAGIATYHDASPVPVGVLDPQGRQIQGGRIFHQSRPDAGANQIVTTYHISSEW